MMEGQMNYTLMPSLEYSALAKIAIALWNHDDITFLIANYDFLSHLSLQEWQEVEDKVIEKVQELPLPKLLKKKVFGIIKPIGFEILRWRNYHKLIHLSRDKRKILNNLYWTSEGTVDRKKTAEALIRDDNLDIRERYELACTYCLKNDILMLFNKIPDCEISFRNIDPVHAMQRELVLFWTSDIKGEVSMLNYHGRRWQGCSPYQYAFKCAAGDGNKVATEYFFQKLTPEEKEDSLNRLIAGHAFNYDHNFVSNKDYAGVLRFLLSQMNEEQQVEVFKNCPYPVLKNLLDWPSQGFFMETAKRVSAFLPENEYDLLLKLIVNKVKDGFTDYNYQKLISEFWQQSPKTHKEYVIAEFIRGPLLKNLLEIKDKENLKLILKNVSTPDREKIIFSHNGKCACEILIYKDEMDLLEFFVQECLSSKDIMIKFREEFIRTVMCFRPKKILETEKDMWNKFFQIINDLIRKDDKRRGLEEGNSGPAKRLCKLLSN